MDRQGLVRFPCKSSQKQPGRIRPVPAARLGTCQLPRWVESGRRTDRAISDRGDKAYPDRDVVVAAGLSLVAGFVDAAGFIALAGLFTAHVTGNFVLIGAELVAASTEVPAKLLALPVFILAVAATRVIALALERRNLQALRPLLTEAALLTVFAVAGALQSPLGLRPPAGDRARWAGSHAWPQPEVVTSPTGLGCVRTLAWGRMATSALRARDARSLRPSSRPGRCGCPGC